MITLLHSQNPQYFPDPQFAETEPNGLLALGGDLSPERLLAAYRQGVFPWYSQGQPLLWWSPDPRLVLFPERLHLSRSLGKALRQTQAEIRFDHSFGQVIRACAAPRARQDGTWINPEMLAAYSELHRLGHAHSVEVWQAGELVGGLYGIALGRIFFGESMFSRAENASKMALAGLVHALGNRLDLIDCQVRTLHLVSLGAEEIPRQDFLQRLTLGCADTEAIDFRHLTPIQASTIRTA
jgi:leucyl/phenylalanyl-tRNA--protein transferase